jgi:hypothetical protein
VDMKAEEFAYINPYQFGNDNPVMFNDPMGDRFGGRNGERGNQMEVNPMNDTWSYSSYSGGLVVFQSCWCFLKSLSILSLRKNN